MNIFRSKLIYLMAVCFGMLIWSLNLPLLLDIVGLLLLIFIVKRGSAGMLFSTGSLFFSLVMLELIVRLIWGESQQFYREHERYALRDRYQANISVDIDMPHGDLAALDLSLPLSVREPRRVHFHTDAWGYRNTADYAGQHWILNGDSFVVANGSDEADTLTSLLKQQYGVDTYQIAFPSDPADYMNRATQFLNRGSQGVKFIFFFYEGNDFSNLDQLGHASLGSQLIKTVSSISEEYDRQRIEFLKRFLPSLRYPKIIYGMSRRALGEMLKREDTAVSLYTVGERQLGFLKPHNELAMASQLALLPFEADEALLSRTSCIFFIPTKLRVYKRYLPDYISSRIQSPAPGIRALKEAFKDTKAEIIDLTPKLQDEAEKYLRLDKYLYWRDDTHWNGTGIRAVLSDVYECIGKDHLKKTNRGDLSLKN